MGNFVPLYRQVSQRIFRKIQQGVYKYGDKIPSEKELVAHYGVNRMTVRRAIALLAEQGILKSVQGKGVFVIDTFYQARISPEGLLFDGTFFQDPRLRQDLLFLQKIPARKAMSELFRVKSDSLLWLLGRRWMAENMAVALEYSYFPAEWIFRRNFARYLGNACLHSVICLQAVWNRLCREFVFTVRKHCCCKFRKEAGLFWPINSCWRKITVSCVILKFWRKPERLHII